RLFAQPLPDGSKNLWTAPHLLMQKLPAETFEATAAVQLSAAAPGDAIALVTLGQDYALVRLVRAAYGWRGEQVVWRGAADEGPESVAASVAGANEAQLRLSVATGSVQFSYSLNAGASFRTIGRRTALGAGRWMGAKFGLVATRAARSRAGGFADV